MRRGPHQDCDIDWAIFAARAKAELGNERQSRLMNPTYLVWTSAPMM
jgi:hypothetical protein